jgi:hypothetical protein
MYCTAENWEKKVIKQPRDSLISEIIGIYTDRTICLKKNLYLQSLNDDASHRKL